MVLRDIWGSSYRDVETVARWMVDALVESALRRAPRARGRGLPRGPWPRHPLARADGA